MMDMLGLPDGYIPYGIFVAGLPATKIPAYSYTQTRGRNMEIKP
ncbi:MAG: hypothetical protein AB9834_21455 [Lentimicrobium sp.]